MKSKKDDPASRRLMADYATVGLMFPVSIVVGFFIGVGLDRLFHTSPILTVVLILFGVAAGFINLFKVTRKHER